MKTEKILALMAIGQLALDQHFSERAAERAKHAYHEAWRSFECGGEPEEWDDRSNRITRESSMWDAALAATKAEHAAYLAAKRKAYNIKRRLQNACRKSAEHR